MDNDTQTGDIHPLDSRFRMGGLLLVDKPGGVTSHDVVAAVRKRVRPLKVGHTGTLDPLATGLLILCVGEATKLARFLEAQDKLYRATALLGVATDTQDITGDVIAEKPRGVPPDALPEDRIRAVEDIFVGAIEQTPPIFSAVKVDGERAYRRARRREDIRLEPRTVRIERLEIERIHLPRVDFLVQCSKGTYVRTLCHDIGEHLGVGACMESLRRLAVGRFKIEDAAPLRELDTTNKILGALIPASEALSHMPAITCGPEQIRRLSNGMTLTVTDGVEAPGEGQWARALGPDGELLAVGKLARDGDETLFRPKRVFAFDPDKFSPC